jgi:hypothetical protein
MTPCHHLLSVWNPSYSADVLDAHLNILLKWAREYADGRAERDDVYVWWAKIRSRNRYGQLPHHRQILALDEQAGAGTETHLYLTDYSSLYVAQVGEITDDDVRVTAGELDHMPPYYKDHPIDFWFRLFDMRLLITDEPIEVIAELKKLRNTAYHDRPVSLYGGMVSLPLIVSRDPPARWFSDNETLIEGQVWAERAAEYRGDAARMSRELRDNLIGRELWPRLEPGTRSFLASAEAVFRTHRDDPTFDLSGVAISYAKAVETELNALLFPAIQRVVAKKPRHEREVRVGEKLLDLGGVVPHQTLGTIKNLLKHEPVVRGAVGDALRHDRSWLLDIVTRELDPILKLRNPGAHSEVTSASELEVIRRTIMGIGREGLLGRVAYARMRTIPSS